MRYDNLLKDVFSIFGSPEWVAEGVPTYPSNFVATPTEPNYIVFYTLPSNEAINRKSLSGVVIIDVYTQAGEGPKNAAIIGDKLDKFLCHKSFSLSGGTTQFLLSSMTLSRQEPLRLNKEEGSLSRAVYTIPFNYFGVI